MVDDLTWGRLTHEQRMRKLSVFLAKGMYDQKDSIQSEFASDSENSSTSTLSVNAAESGITNVPVAVLKLMFDKAANLLCTPGKCCSETWYI